jgi:hypothetical protein
MPSQGGYKEKMMVYKRELKSAERAFYARYMGQGDWVVALTTSKREIVVARSAVCHV